MARIAKQDTDGTKSTLLKGELGYDDYIAGGDAGRVYVGDGSTNIPLAKQSELIHNHNGVYEPADADIVKTDVANTFTAPQRTSITAEDNAIDFTANNNFSLTATAANITVGNVTGCTGQSGVITIASAENVTGWGTEFKFKTVPTTLTGTERFAYFVESESSIAIGLVQ